MKKKPNLLLLGAQKSASTFFSKWFSGHPGVYIRSREDTSFENPEYQNFDLSRLEMDLEETVYGIRRPDYFCNETYQERLHTHLPDAKIIVLLRNPTDRAISAFYHYMKYGITPPQKPIYIQNLLQGNFPKHIGAYTNILDYGLYYKHLTTLLKYYDKSQVLLLKQEEVTKGDPEALFRKVCTFLGIDFHLPAKPTAKLQSSLYDYQRLKFQALYLNKRYQYDEGFNKSYTKPFVELPLTNRLWIKVCWKTEKILFKDRNHKDEIPQEIVNELKAFYQDDLNQLQGFWKEDLSGWLA